MENTNKLRGLTLFITGASRGIGRAIAIKAAKDGANIVITARANTKNSLLPGTIYTTLQEVEKAGGNGLACVMDVKEEAQVKSAVEAAVKKYGGIDIVINNASISIVKSTEALDMEKYDIINSTNVRGSFLVTKYCLPYLKKSAHGHVLNFSPPLKMTKKYFEKFGVYAVSKFGITWTALRMHHEFQPYNISVNTLWPKVVVESTAVVTNLGETTPNHCRKPEIMADAAYAILTQHPKPSGQCFIDEEVLLKAGVADLEQYLVNPQYKNDLFYCYYEDGDHEEDPFNWLTLSKFSFQKK